MKVLDFGLAKAMELGRRGRQPSVSMSPTITTPAMTQAGMILGHGRVHVARSRRAGNPSTSGRTSGPSAVVLWEMLTGTNPFAGETISHTLAFVMTKEPDWNGLPRRHAGAHSTAASPRA